MKIAIIGSGISGLVCAYHLSSRYQVDLYESHDYLGGHCQTHDLEIDKEKIRVDTGFIVFNKKTYPLFLDFLETLNVAYVPTSMSFSVSCEQTGLEYNGTDFNRLFAQRSNLLRPSYYSFLLGISEFNKKAKNFLQGPEVHLSLKDFFIKEKIRTKVIEYYILPMMAAVWSTEPAQVWDFPARFVLRFFENHGFLEINERPQWYIIKGGSNSYIPKIIEKVRGKVFLGRPVISVERMKDSVSVKTLDHEETYNNVIFATHSDITLKLIKNPTQQEKEILSSIPYISNPTFLHTDRSFLPKRKLAWASWNYSLPAEQKKGATVTYQMNILQNLKNSHLFNVTLNPHRPIDPKKILKALNYDHPLFTLNSVHAQSRWLEISGKNHSYFCGAYWRNGFHEDGVFSALRVIDQIEEK